MIGNELPDCRSRSARCVKRLFPILICTSIFFISFDRASLQAQDLPTASSGKLEAGISMSVEVRGIRYQRGGTVTVRYRVANRQKSDLYLITGGRVKPGYDLSRRVLVMGLDKEILNYHYLDYPRLERIKPGKGYQGEATLSLSFLGKQFMEGKWLLYLSIGYLDARAMGEITSLLRTHHPEELAQQFDQRQKLFLVGPIEIELTER